MRFFSLKAASIYIITSAVLYAYEFINLWGNYFESASQKPVYPILYYLNNTFLNPLNILIERHILIELIIFGLIPFLNILGLIISIKNYQRKKTNSLAVILIILAIIPWLAHFYMMFFR